jgi:hypothetical protein
MQQHLAQSSSHHKGVTLLAIGSIKYGLWAWQLAHSLKYFSELPVQLIVDPTVKSGLDGRLGVFDEVTEIPETITRRFDILNPCWAKLNLDRFFCWEHTLFLDVDALCINSVDPLFERKTLGIQCAGRNPGYSVCDRTEGIFENMLWMRLDDFEGKPGIRDTFKLDGLIPGTNTSAIIYNGEQEVFERAREAYEIFNEKHTAQDLHMKWGRKHHPKRLPDELFFNVALSQMGPEQYLMERVVHFHTPKDGAQKTLEQLRAEGKKILGYWGDLTYNSFEHRQKYDRVMSKVVGSGRVSVHQLMKGKFVSQHV